MRIREARQSKGMTMKELGKRIGTTESAISLYERGLREPPFQALLMMAEELGTTVGYLLGAEEQKTVPALTVTENQLLEIFRQLNDDGQTACLTMARSLLLNFAQKNHTNFVNEVTG